MVRTFEISGVDWSDGSPRLRARIDGRPSEPVPVVGLHVNYSAGAHTARRCVGHKPFRDSSVAWVDCDRPPLHDGNKCDRCATVDAVFASQLHHAHTLANGELDPAVVRHLQQPNALYLAMFRDGSIKVGTSTERRLQERLDEQGAWRARIVANARDGMAVRILEDRVSAEIGIPQSVSIRRKLDGLVRPVPDDRLIDALDLWEGRVHELLDGLGDSRLERTSTVWTFGRSNDAMWDTLHPYPLKLDRGNHDLEFVAASGRVVVVRRPGTADMFVADVRQLYGLRLELGEHRPDELAVQDALF